MGHVKTGAVSAAVSKNDQRLNPRGGLYPLMELITWKVCFGTI